MTDQKMADINHFCESFVTLWMALINDVVPLIGALDQKMCCFGKAMTNYLFCYSVGKNNLNVTEGLRIKELASDCHLWESMWKNSQMKL